MRILLNATNVANIVCLVNHDRSNYYLCDVLSYDYEQKAGNLSLGLALELFQCTVQNLDTEK